MTAGRYTGPLGRAGAPGRTGVARGLAGRATEGMGSGVGYRVEDRRLADGSRVRVVAIDGAGGPIVQAHIWVPKPGHPPGPYKIRNWRYETLLDWAIRYPADYMSAPYHNLGEGWFSYPRAVDVTLDERELTIGSGPPRVPPWLTIDAPAPSGSPGFFGAPLADENTFDLLLYAGTVPLTLYRGCTYGETIDLAEATRAIAINAMPEEPETLVAQWASLGPQTEFYHTGVYGLLSGAIHHVAALDYTNGGTFLISPAQFWDEEGDPLPIDPEYGTTLGAHDRLPLARLFMWVQPLIPADNLQQLDYVTMLAVIEINGEDVAVAVRLRHVAPEVCTVAGDCISTLILERPDQGDGGIGAPFAAGTRRLVVDGFVPFLEANPGFIGGDVTQQIEIHSTRTGSGGRLEFPGNQHYLVGHIEAL